MATAACFPAATICGCGNKRWKPGDEVVIHCNQDDGDDEECNGGDPMYSPSQRIWGYETPDGSFAQFCRVQSRQLMERPKHLTWEEAAAYMLVAATDKGVCRLSFDEGREALEERFPAAELVEGGDEFSALLKEVVDAVEARHYPAAAAKARKLGWHEELGNGLKGAARALLVNLIALPFALVLLVTGVGAPLLFLAVNAVLLGRELQDMVWLRHRPAPTSPAPLSRIERWSLGGVCAVLLTLPGINLLAPFLGAAAAAHFIHRKDQT